MKYHQAAGITASAKLASVIVTRVISAVSAIVEDYRGTLVDGLY